jgi:hypothetical protein
MSQLNSEDAMAEDKAGLCISPTPETFIWQVNPDPHKLAVPRRFLGVFASLLFTSSCRV